MRSRILGAAFSVVGLLVFSGCVPAQTSIITETPTAAPPTIAEAEVTQEQFEAALETFTISHNEFVDGTFIVSQNPAFPKRVQNSLLVFVPALGIDPKGQPVFSLATKLSADDWWFHKGISLKTSTGAFTLSIDPSRRSDVVEGNGAVSEAFNSNFFKESEIDELCLVARGDELRVQFWPGQGSSKKAETLTWPASGLKALADACVIYRGLSKGLSTPAITG